MFRKAPFPVPEERRLISESITQSVEEFESRLRSEDDEILSELLRRVGSHALSIALVGSHAQGEANDSSDIDLIIVAVDKHAGEAIRKAERALNDSVGRPRLDCKVYTRDEFNSAKSGRENRFLWTCLSNSRLLFGADISTGLRLNPQSVVESIWTSLKNVEQAIEALNAQTQFTGCCYNVYDAIATMYFVERNILGTVKRTLGKADYIKALLGGHYEKVRERYYWVVQQLKAGHMTGSLRIPLSADRQFRAEDYSDMADASMCVLQVLNSVYRKTTSWTERAA